jgi:hypothetical protein
MIHGKKNIKIHYSKDELVVAQQRKPGVNFFFQKSSSYLKIIASRVAT